LDGKSCALSLEEPVGFDSETGEAVALGDLLAGTHEDPSEAVARNLDWAEFLQGRDRRDVALALRGEMLETPGTRLNLPDPL